MSTPRMPPYRQHNSTIHFVFVLNSQYKVKGGIHGPNSAKSKSFHDIPQMGRLKAGLGKMNEEGGENSHGK